MLDPIGGFQRIRELYITYLETAFRIRDPHVSRERCHLLETPGTLCTEPLIEPIPRYETCDFQLDELAHSGIEDSRLPGFTPQERAAFAELALSGLFDAQPASPGAAIHWIGKHSLYKHQAEMLWRGVQPGKPGIVTSGTGSGKTESFLLPIFAMLAKEAIHWPASGTDFLRRRWWQDATGEPYRTWKDVPNRPSKAHPDQTPFVPHRQHERRPAAVRALILYPMNALVEDQLVRIRRALDSDAARETMERQFNRNRIFLGRYTSVTPVTGFHRHPRPGEKEYLRQSRKLRELFKAMQQLQQTQDIARQAQLRAAQDDPRFLFPSIDGSELSSRWDMQAHPPDILITNVSMLNAMLAREVDAPIFDQTRRWLLDNEEAYFFLVLDELHLQRGSAGTEVSFLLRLLFHRLGLTDPAHQHKLRILASSASLPMQGKTRDDSLEYLWNAFGRHGMWTVPGIVGDPIDRSSWQEAVIEGKTRKEEARGTHLLQPAPYQALIDSSPTTPHKESAIVHDPREQEAIWRTIASDLLGCSDHADLAALVRECVEEAGYRLAVACWSEEDGRPRATTLGTLAQRLFSAGTSETTEAVRGLLIVRGVDDQFDAWFSDPKPQAPSFRVHTFFRSIEGLFGPADGQAGVATEFRSVSRPVGRLDVERDVRYERSITPAGKAKRRFELLYCECCGELFFGGMRPQGMAGKEPELLPNDPDLDGLPDTAVSQRFEELSAEVFAVFWPACGKKPQKSPTAEIGSWIDATLAPETGQIQRLGPATRKGLSEGLVRGYFYYRPFDKEDSHQRKGTDPGTAVPYACPACGSDYSQRRKEYRLAPIRNFRTGFAKTTQLLATELFDLLKLDAAEPKLVSFSDSRQDAASAALDIERRHHEDVRRQILVETLRERVYQRVPRAQLEHELAEVLAGYREAVVNDEEEQAEALRKRRDELRAQIASASDPAVPLSDVLETVTGNATNFLGPRGQRAPLRPLLRRFVELGIHPTDPTGVERFELGSHVGMQKAKQIPWDWLFHIPTVPGEYY